MKTVMHPWDQRGPNMFCGFDADGNQVAIEIIDDGMDEPHNGSPIVSMVEHQGHLYLAKSNGVFRWNEQQQKFEPLQFVKIDE